AELAAARETGQVAGRRLLLVGGQVAALLLAFAVLAAVGMRRDVEAAGQRLTWVGDRGGGAPRRRGRLGSRESRHRGACGSRGLAGPGRPQPLGARRRRGRRGG